MSVTIYSNGKKAVIPSCTSQDIYSTEEQVVGRWIDGKPLYKKVIVGVLVTTLNVWNTSYTDPNVSEFVSATGFIDDANGDRYFIPQASINGVVIIMLGISGGNTIKMLTNQSGFINVPICLVIKYTKTTDQATIELPAALTAAPEQTIFTAAPQSVATVTLDAGMRNEEV